VSDTDKSKPEGYVFGRPTKYEPWMCEKVIEWGRAGKSRAWIAGNLGVAKSTMQRWEAENEDFQAAITYAHTLSQIWWEDKGQDALENREFQASVWSRSMAARFPDDWREKVGHVGGGKDDEPIRQELTLDADAFTRAVAGLAARSGEGGETGGA
jgi:DNA-binding XRE family transcriptional regulator